MRLVPKLFLFALMLSQAALAQTPTTWDGWAKLASEQILKADDKGAIASTTECIKLNAAAARCYAVRGAARSILGEYGLAITDLNKAIELEPDFQTVYATLADAQIQAKAFDGAIATTTKAITRFSGILNGDILAEYYFTRGVAYINAGWHNDGLADLSTALRTGGRTFRETYKGHPYTVRSIVYCKKGEFDLAVYDERKAKEFGAKVDKPCNETDSALASGRPIDFEASGKRMGSGLHIMNGLGAIIDGNMTKAIADFTKAIEMYPRSAEAYFQRAQVYQRTNQTQSAKADIEQALKLNPNYEEAAELKKEIDEILRIKPAPSAPSATTQPTDKKKATEHYQAGLVSKVIRDFIAAEESFTQALQYAPNDPDILIQRANVRYAQRKYDDALLDFNNAIRIDDKDARAWHWRGLLYDAMGKQDLAVSDYSRAIQLDPAKAVFFADRASVYSDLGKIELALADIDQALKLDPKNQRALEVKRRLGSYLPASTTKSSENVIFFDGFDDNRHNWAVGKSDYVDGFIANGRQTIDLRTDVYHRTMLGTTAAPQIDQTKDFMIETSITFVSGAENYPFGINWGMKDLHANSFEFGINAVGQFHFSKIVNGQWQAIVGWTVHPAVKTGAGATNKLTIRKRGGKLELSINDTLVATRDYETYTASASIGFNIGFKKKIEIDYLKVVQFK